MIAYKGCWEDLTCTFGKGKYQYFKGRKIKEESSKCAARGLHCAEYPFDCFHWYPPGKGCCYFEVEAAGSLDECGWDTQISCTEMTLLRQLTVFQMAARGMMYMVEYPKRAWECQAEGVSVTRDRAQGHGPDTIGIARGERPKVKGAEGSILGLLCEDSDGNIIDAKVFQVKGGIKPDTWYRLEGRVLKETEG